MYYGSTLSLHFRQNSHYQNWHAQRSTVPNQRLGLFNKCADTSSSKPEGRMLGWLLFCRNRFIANDSFHMYLWFDTHAVLDTGNLTFILETGILFLSHTERLISCHYVLSQVCPSRLLEKFKNTALKCLQPYYWITMDIYTKLFNQAVTWFMRKESPVCRKHISSVILHTSYNSLIDISILISVPLTAARPGARGDISPNATLLWQ